MKIDGVRRCEGMSLVEKSECLLSEVLVKGVDG